jgi:hypothetical protein
MTTPSPEPPALHERAIQDLSFIRRTMEGAAAFTDVPGWGLVGLGVLALGAAFLSAAQTDATGWLLVWLGTAAVGALLGASSMYRKMRRRLGHTIEFSVSSPARKFFLGYWPAIAAGAVLTIALVDVHTPGVDARVVERVLPGLWLLLYGVGVTTAGAHSIRAVPLMGIAFMALGTTALLLPALHGTVAMALGFGGLHLGVGGFIARRHGG